MQRKTVDSDTTSIEPLLSEDTTSHSENASQKYPLTSEDRFQSLVVLEFGDETPPSTVEWVLSKLISPPINGGAQLLAKNVQNDPKKKTTVHISGTNDRLLIAAELMELKKPYSDGSLREISIADIEHFQDSDDLENFLKLAEKQRIVKHEAEMIRAMDIDKHVPGLPKVSLYKGEAIIPKLMSEGVITKLYPLHDKEQLKILSTDWVKAVVRDQPIEKIREYFGETIAMYFAFLGHYTMALVPPAMIGVMSVFYHSMYLQIFFSIFNIVWATFFLESWKRHCSTWSYKWGTLGTDQFEEARPAYYGELGVNKVTGRLEPQYPKFKKKLKFYCVSVPVVLFCLWIAFELMLFYFWMQAKADLWYKESPNFFTSMNSLIVPSTIYAIIISVGNMIFRKIAYALNDWENHRLQSAYENHLIVKLVAFDFVNCFLSLFYVAFYLQDLVLLRSHLASLMIMTQIMGQLLESVLPYLMYKRRKSQIKAQAGNKDAPAGIEKLGFADEVDEATILQAQIEASKDEYEGTLDDYLEMFLQFGYVFLFSAVFPSAALWALINNITEIRSDAFKMCSIFQRPFARPTSNIGAWQIALEVMSAMAVVTNCALIALSPQFKDYMEIYGSMQIIFIVVIVEHVLLFVKVMISYMIPDYPEWVENAVARVEYESKQAWRKERSLSSKKALKSKSSSEKPDNVEDKEITEMTEETASE